MTDHAELNAFLAEHVMGLHYHKGVAYISANLRGLQRLWDPASRPEQALEVAEKIGSYYTVVRHRPAGLGPYFRAVFHDGQYDGRIRAIDDEAFALAVCRAARAWKESNDEDT